MKVLRVIKKSDAAWRDQSEIEASIYFDLLKKKLPTYGAARTTIPGYYKEYKFTFDGKPLLVHCSVIFDLSTDRHRIAPEITYYVLRKQGRTWETYDYYVFPAAFTKSFVFPAWKEGTGNEAFNWVKKNWDKANSLYNKMVAVAKSL